MIRFKRFLREYDEFSIHNFLKAVKAQSRPDPYIKSGDVFMYNGVQFVIEPSVLKQKVHIEEIIAMKWGQGSGSVALRWICGLADKFDVTLTLEPVQLKRDGPTQTKLIEFYKRFGFVLTGDLMTRKPNKDNNG